MDTTALVAHAAHDLRLEPRRLAEPRATEALVRVRLGGVCGSDPHCWQHGRVGESVHSGISRSASRNRPR